MALAIVILATITIPAQNLKCCWKSLATYFHTKGISAKTCLARWAFVILAPSTNMINCKEARIRFPTTRAQLAIRLENIHP